MSPRDAVVIVLLDDDQRVLMIRRAAGIPRAGVWTPPTGRVEEGEPLRAAVIREAREELGIAVRALAQSWTSLTDDARYRLHWWMCRADSLALQPDAREVADWRWIRSGQFDELQPTFPQHREFFAHVLPAWIHDHGG